MLGLTLFACFWLGSNLFQNAHSQGCQSVDISYASYYASYMVLQRPPARPRIWGFASEVDIDVTVEIESVETVVTRSVADPSGQAIWEAVFQPIDGQGPYTVNTTAADCTIVLDNVLVGDVYVCSGQSNMVHRLDRLDDPQPEIDDVVNYPLVRTFQAALVYSDTPLTDLNGVTRNWALPTTSNMPSFSAVCWLFGRNLFRRLQRPIGLIQTAWGGTRIEAWSSPEALTTCFPGGVGPGGNPQNDPSALWNAMIHPFLQMPIYGAIWYQGEANTGNADYYGCALKAMVSDWRSNWFEKSPDMDPAFSFGQVQLAPNQDRDVSTGFPDVRWSQTYTYGYTPNDELFRIYTAVALDLPDFDSPYGSIHPRYKRQIADRLTLGAFHVAYNITDVGIYQGPMPTSIVQISNDTLEVRHDIMLQYRGADGFEVCCAQTPSETCESGGTGQWSLTSIIQSTILSFTLSIPCVPGEFATGIRYVWRESPCALEQCAVYSVENNLPAPPYVTYNIQ